MPPQAVRSTPLPMDWVRARFPALATDWVLMDNAGGSVPLGRVIDRISEYMARWPVQLGASYALSAEAGELLEQARESLASMMSVPGGARPGADELVIGSSTSSLVSRLARAIAPGLSPGDEIIVTDADHEANITPWRRLAERGITLRTWHLNRDTRRLEIDDLLPLLNDRSRLVCFTHASNLLGEATPLAEITALAHRHGARVCVDGVAYAPHRPLPVRDWDVDFYVFSLYKVYGPHCAVMFARRDRLAELRNINHEFMDAMDGPGKLEPGGFPYELLYGAAAVPEYFSALARQLGETQPWPAIAAQEAALGTRLLDYLNGRPEIEIMGSPEPSPARLPTISFVARGHRSSEIPPLCEPDRIGIRWGHFYAPRLVERLGLTGQDGVVRVSLVHYNTAAEVDALIGSLDRGLDSLGS
ncbi:MAG: aminotransferase class V-fold PLP-dependent enzyme [Gammaproteobacteria bacterium]